MPVSLEQSDAMSIVRLDGDINITSAAELKELLLKALASRSELCIDSASATGLDVTALQLLWAAEREARGAGLAFSLVGQVPEMIALAMSDIGCEKFPVGVK